MNQGHIALESLQAQQSIVIDRVLLRINTKPFSVGVKYTCHKNHEPCQASILVN
jgi:hypothetical protein